MLHLLALICALLPHSRGNDYYGEYIGDFKNRLLIEIFKDSGSILNYTQLQVSRGYRGGVCSWLENHLYQGLQVHFFVRIRTIKAIFPQLRRSWPRCVLLHRGTGGTFGEWNPHSGRQGNSWDPWELQERGHCVDPSRRKNPANHSLAVGLVWCVRGELWWGEDTAAASVSQTAEDSSLQRHPRCLIR